MAIIYSYPLNTPKREDLLIGTITYDEDAVNPVHGNPTVSFTVGSLLDLVAAQGAAQNLQQVTNIGNTTTNSIVISNSLKVAGEYYDSSNQPGTAGQLLSSTATGTQWVNVAAQGVTSVGLSMPAAFTVANSPITQSGILTVTGAGTAAQYINGLGNLITFPTIPTPYVLPVATTVALGGIKIGYTEAGKNYPLELDNEQAYVNVPWTDTVYTLPLAADGTRGGVQIGYVENAKNYPVELSSEKMFVNVPWTDTPYVLPVATATDLGGVKIGYTENAKNYPVELDSDQMYVNVPWTDTQNPFQTITGTGSDNTDSGVLLSNSGGTVKILGDGTVITAAQSGNTITLTGVNTWVANSLNVAGYVAAPGAVANKVWKTDANGNPAWRDDANTDTGITGVTLATGTSTGSPLSESITNRELTLTSLEYDGGSNIGYVPAGGTATTYLKGDGSWAAIPTGLQFKGTWDASGGGGGNPDLTQAANKGAGFLWICDVAGTAYPNGGTNPPSTWALGDWAVYDGTAWTRVPATNSGVTSLTTTDGSFINLTPNAATTGAVTVTADLSAQDGTSDTSTRFLSKDNTWDVPSYTTDNDTTYTVDVPTATTSINLKGSDGTDDAIVLTGGTNVTLSRTDASTIDIAATDTNTQNEYATSWVQSTNDILLRLTESGAGSGTQDIKIVKGANITFTYTDANNFTIAAANTQENTTWTVRDSADSDKDVDNLKFLKFVTATGTLGTALTGAGSTSDPYVMTLTSPDTDTTYSAMTTSTLGLGKIRYDFGSTPAAEAKSEIANRTYGVTKNASDQLVVNVPWVSGGSYNWTIKDNAANPGSSVVDSGETIQFVTATGALGTALTEPTAGNFVMTLTSPDTDTTYSDFTGATALVAGTNGLVVAPPAGAQGKFLRGDATWVNETTYSAFTGADGTNAGTSGLVPAPAAADNVKFLKGDGTWAATPQGDITEIKTTAPITGAATSGIATIAINTMGAATANAAGTKGAVPASAAGDQLKFLRADATWVVPTDTNTNTTYTIESANSKQISLVPSDVSSTASAANNYSNTNTIQVDTIVGTIANGYLIEGTGIPAGVFITNIQTFGSIKTLTLSQTVSVANNTPFSFKARTAVTLADGSGITISGNNDTITITNSDGDTGLPAIIVDDAQGNMSFGNTNVTAATVRTKIGAGTGDGLVESLTTTGTSGAATLSNAGVLNIPEYENTQENTKWYVRDSGDDDKTINDAKYLKFVTATGALSTNLTGAGSTSDPFVMTLTSPDTTTNDNDYLTNLAFNTGDGVLTATVQNQSDVTVDLDGRYLTSESDTLADVTARGATTTTKSYFNGDLEVENEITVVKTDVNTPGKITINGNTDATLQLKSEDTALAANETLGVIEFYGSDGTAPGAGVKSSIRARNGAQTGGVGDTSNLIFAVSDGTSNNNEALRINPTGSIAIDGATKYGTSGQLLQSNGDAPPTWVDAPGGGPFLPLTGGTLSGGLTVDDTINAERIDINRPSNDGGALTIGNVSTSTGYPCALTMGNVNHEMDSHILMRSKDTGTPAWQNWIFGLDYSDKHFKIGDGVVMGGGNTYLEINPSGDLKIYEKLVVGDTSLSATKGQVDIKGISGVITTSLGQANQSHLNLRVTNTLNRQGQIVWSSDVNVYTFGLGAIGMVMTAAATGTNTGTADMIFSTKSGAADAASTERMRITSSGNVGIGTGSSPSGKFHVKVGTSTPLIVSSNSYCNNVGIRTTTPTASLQVKGNISYSYVNYTNVANTWMSVISMAGYPTGLYQISIIKKTNASTYISAIIKWDDSGSGSGSIVGTVTSNQLSVSFNNTTTLQAISGVSTGTAMSANLKCLVMNEDSCS